MRIVVQRVSRAHVTVTGRTTGGISSGVVVFVGIGKDDTPADAAYLAEKTAHLRIFNDPVNDDSHGKMNLSLIDVGGAALVISQFTLYGDVRHGRRPGFDRAAGTAEAAALYQEYVRCPEAQCVRVETGVFQAHMEVELSNDGPVIILLDSEKTF